MTMAPNAVRRVLLQSVPLAQLDKLLPSKHEKLRGRSAITEVLLLNWNIHCTCAVVDAIESGLGDLVQVKKQVLEYRKAEKANNHGH